MKPRSGKLEHTRLEKYLSMQFHFRLNEITGSIEFKKREENNWDELNEFNIYRQLKLEGFKINLNELIYLLKSVYVQRFNPFLSYFENLPVWQVGEPDYINKLCSYIKLRNPERFERKAKKLSRRASFIGSTNMTEFLSDPTGNVRWIPFEITGIDWNYSTEINIDDVWKQAYSLYKSGFAPDITAEEVKENEEENKQFIVVSPEMELIMKYYSPGTKESYDLFRTTGEIEIGLKEATNGMAKLSNHQLWKALRMLGFMRDNRYEKGKEYPIKAYYLKFRSELKNRLTYLLILLKTLTGNAFIK